MSLPFQTKFYWIELNWTGGMEWLFAHCKTSGSTPTLLPTAAALHPGTEGESDSVKSTLVECRNILTSQSHRKVFHLQMVGNSQPDTPSWDEASLSWKRFADTIAGEGTSYVSDLNTYQDSNNISLERGARQGDNIFPKLFTACLQGAITNKIDWEEKGINIDGEHLSHLIFADDIILIAHIPQELQEMLVDINNYSKPVGLNMHLGKTKIMLNNHTEKATVEPMEKP